jgi:hypothetical protein
MWDAALAASNVGSRFSGVDQIDVTNNVSRHSQLAASCVVQSRDRARPVGNAREIECRPRASRSRIQILEPLFKSLKDLAGSRRFTARLPRRAVLFGGWSNDRLITVSCDQYDPNKLRFCDRTGQTFQQYRKTSMPAFRNDFKLSGNYPVAWGIEVNGVFMSYAGRNSSARSPQTPGNPNHW